MDKPIRPNITIPAEFAVNGVKTPFSNAKIQDGFDRINPDVLAGDNLNKFIDDTYKGLNYSMDSVDYLEKKIQITNCILEDPQRINFEIDNGTVTLKAGSVVCIPDGFETDGTTPKFKEFAITNDITHTNRNYDFTNFMFYQENTGTIVPKRSDYIISGTTEPTSNKGVWYDTSVNLIKMYSLDTSSWEVLNASLPFAITTSTSTDGYVSINQIFQSIGYLGTLVFARKGLKVLIPNGRNAEGSLNNIEYTLENDVSRIISDNNNVSYYAYIKIDNSISIMNTKDTFFLDTLDTTLTKTRQYINNENKWYTIDSNGNATVEPMTFVGVIDFSNSIITKFTSFNTVNLLKQSDKSEISGWGMPSDKYIELTLGASGTTYTAPANGYYQCYIGGQSGYKWLRLFTSDNYLQEAGFSTNNNISFTVPIQKGQTLNVKYSGTLTTRGLVFIYAQGSESEA